MSDKIIKENAAAGSTGASSIAVSMERAGQRRNAERQWRDSVIDGNETDENKRSEHIKKQLQRAKELKAERDKGKKKSFSDFFRKRKIAEEFDMASIVAQLKGAEHSGSDKINQAVSYGIEDDKGNFMRVTVKSDQAKEFEMLIARKMADNKDNTALGLSNQKGSLAEILFDLQNQFDILDVEFPIIPKDAVYNQEEATVGQPNQVQPDLSQNQNLDGQGLDDMNLDNSNLMSDENGDQESLDMSGDMDQDMDNVEPFGNEDESSDPGSLLKSLVDMLKKQAEAETAKANAAAEQARATQAEWSSIAADKEIQRQEELAKVQSVLDEKKRREKQAKEYAEIAKYNATQGKGALDSVGEAYELGDSILQAVLVEDAFDDPTTLQKAKQEVMQKYQVNPNDDQLTKNYKAAALKLELDQLNSRIKLAALNKQYNNQKQTVANQQSQPQSTQQTSPTAQPAANTPANAQPVPNGSVGQMGG